MRDGGCSGLGRGGDDGDASNGGGDDDGWAGGRVLEYTAQFMSPAGHTYMYSYT